MPDKWTKSRFEVSWIAFIILVFTQAANSAPQLPPLNSSNTGEQLPGKFIWYDLATTEIDKQKSFYGNVFGWTFRTVGETDDEYTLVVNGDRNIAGLFSIEPRNDSPMGALWFGLVSSNDPNQAVSIAKQNGGAIHTPPTTLAQRGTFAILRDPEGALFGVLKSDSGDPPDRDVEIGDFLWMDLFADQPEKASLFYQQLVGYETTSMVVKEGINRVILAAQGKSRAGIVPLPEKANRAGWLPYIRVDDLKTTLEKISAAGGYVVVPPAEDLLDGNLAIFADPQGGMLGIVKWIVPATDKE